MIGFSVLLTRYYEDRSDREPLPTIVTILGLTIVLASITLVPIDIFLLSSMVNPTTGKLQGWATEETVAQQLNTVSVLYYGAPGRHGRACLARRRALTHAHGDSCARLPLIAVYYGVMSLFVFIVIPFAYFYFEEYEEGRTNRQVSFAGPLGGRRGHSPQQLNAASACV